MPPGEGSPPAAEGREWWLQLQRQRAAEAAQRPLQIDPEALRDALLLSYDCSPELAADLGLGTDPDISQPAGVQDDATPAPAAAAEDGLAEGASAAAAAVGPAAGGGGRHGTLLRASQTLLHKMSAFQRLEEDVMAQLTSAEDAADEASLVRRTSSDRVVKRSSSEARQISGVLAGGADLLARAQQVSTAYCQHRAGAGAPAGGQQLQQAQVQAQALADGAGPSQAGLSLHNSDRLWTIQEGGAAALAAGSRRKSILGQACSTSLGAVQPPSRKHVSLTLPVVAGGPPGTAQSRWEEEQEAELAEVLRQGAFGDAEIQEYLARELARSRGRGHGGRAAGAGRNRTPGGGEGGEEDDRLDPIVQAWLVTKVPAPRVEGYTPPPSRTACRLIAAQEMQKYYASQQRRAGPSWFKWLGLSQQQAGNRAETGKFLVGSDEQLVDGGRKGPRLKAAVRSSIAASKLSDMVQGVQATVWAREHVKQVAASAARGLARQRATHNWQLAFAKVKALPPGAAEAWGPLGGGAASAALPAQEVQGTEAVVDALLGTESAVGQALPQQQRGSATQQLGPPEGAATAAGGRPSGASGSRAQSRMSSFRSGSAAGFEGSAAGDSLQGEAGLARASSCAGGAPALASRAPVSTAGDRASAGPGGSALSRASSRLGHTPSGRGASGMGGQGAGERDRAAGEGRPALRDFASVAEAVLEGHRKRGGRAQLSKLPPLYLERLEQHWVSAMARRQNTERKREEARARAQLRERWAGVKERRGGGGQP